MKILRNSYWRLLYNERNLCSINKLMRINFVFNYLLFIKVIFIIFLFFLELIFFEDQACINHFFNSTESTWNNWSPFSTSEGQNKYIVNYLNPDDLEVKPPVHARQVDFALVKQPEPHIKLKLLNNVNVHVHRGESERFFKYRSNTLCAISMLLPLR